jgi:uncharacterized membrane protein YidH (DUF202 family)
MRRMFGFFAESAFDRAGEYSRARASKASERNFMGWKE